MKKLAAIQSNYIPWKGYFDIINMADEFVLYDDVQYTKNDWRNRNIIKTSTGLQWITIPVFIEKLSQTIDETRIADKKWNKKHWKTLRQNYLKAPFFNEYAEEIEAFYMQREEDYLSEVNRHFIEFICNQLNIKTTIRNVRDYNLVNGRIERLIDLCKKLKVNEYISGPSARQYIDEELFRAEGIKITWIDYAGYPEYPQLWAPFEHGVSILDVLFNMGHETSQYMKSFLSE